MQFLCVRASARCGGRVMQPPLEATALANDPNCGLVLLLYY